MKSELVIYFEKLLDDNLIAYMEVLDNKKDNIDLVIKVYFPKIVANICTFLNTKFDLEKKDEIVISRASSGYHFVDIFFMYEKQRIGVRIQSILKNTWGIDKNS